MGAPVQLWTLGSMTRRGAEIEVNDVGGGLHTAVAITEVNQNESYDMSNLVIGPTADYLRTRGGNTAFNSSAMNSGVAVQGLAYYRLIAGTEFLVAVCGAKVYKAEMDGTMDDGTGAVSITANQDNIWTLFTFNNLLI